MDNGGIERPSVSFLNLQSLLELSLVLNEVESEDAIWRLAALALVGKLQLTAAAIGLRSEFPALRFITGSRKGQAMIQQVLAEDNVEDTDFWYTIHQPEQSPVFAVLVRRRHLTPLPPEATTYVDLVLSLTAHAYRLWQRRQQLEQLWRDRERKNQLLQASLDMTQAFARVWQLPKIQQLLALTLRGQFRTTRFAFWAWEGETCLLEQVHLPPAVLSAADPLRQWQQGIWVIDHRWRAIGSQWGKNGKLLLIVESLPKSPEEEESHQWFLETLSSVVGTALERFRLIQEEMAKQKLEEELNFAARIQQQLFPEQVLLPPEYQFFAHNTPSRFVGGDYYDVVQQTENRQLFVIADVSGKGVPASLLMANFQAALQILAREQLHPEEIARKLNEHLVVHTHPEQFVTCFFLTIDLVAGTATSVNAGHFPPLLRNAAGQVQRLEKGGLPLGLFAAATYESETFAFPPGSLLVAYTDGVIEAHNAVGEQYGEERLIEVLQQFAGSAEQWGKTLLQNVLDFTSGTLQDDLTFFVLYRQPHQSLPGSVETEQEVALES